MTQRLPCEEQQPHSHGKAQEWKRRREGIGEARRRRLNAKSNEHERERTRGPGPCTEVAQRPVDHHSDEQEEERRGDRPERSEGEPRGGLEPGHRNGERRADRTGHEPAALAFEPLRECDLCDPVEQNEVEEEVDEHGVLRVDLRNVDEVERAQHRAQRRALDSRHGASPHSAFDGKIPTRHAMVLVLLGSVLKGFAHRKLN